MEIVLGVSMTPTTVSIALVEGAKGDGVIIEHDVFDIGADADSATWSASEHVVAAILGTQEGAITAGHHLVSTGVTWADHEEAAVLREALMACGIEDVLLVSELHAAAALAQAVGRAVGYDKTALMFVERDIATVAVVETADGSVVKVLSKRLHGVDTMAALTEMVTGLDAEKATFHGMFVVGSGVDVTAVKARLRDLVAVPVFAPDEPRLALARGAALASANAPRYDASTVGVAYSQDPDESTFSPSARPDVVATTFLGHVDVDTDGIASDSDDVSERGRPLLLSSVTAIFVAGMLALTTAIAINARPPVDEDLGAMAMQPNAAAPPAAAQPAPPAAAQPAPPAARQPVPNAAPAPSAIATAKVKIPPAPPPRPVLVRNPAPAPAAPAPPPPPPPAAPPPVVIPPEVVQWLPQIFQPPRYNPPQGPRGFPGPKGPPGGHGGRHGHGGDGDGD